VTEPATPAAPAVGPLGHDHGYGPDIDHVLLSEADIQAKITELAAQVAVDYAGREVLLVGVLKGAVLFMSDFARTLQLPTQMEFMAVSSYGSSTSSSGVVRILKDLDRDTCWCSRTSSTPG
jgi:hypoxanthine phosphoribosyltransferase